jgi:hypothetical protein
LALIAYNGIGRIWKETPADWLLELDGKVGLTRLPFKDVLQEMRSDTESRLRKISIDRKKKRHSFVIGAWGRGKTWICLISNYENLGTNEVKESAQDYFTISALPEVPGGEIRVVVTGDTNKLDPEYGAKIVSVAKKRGAAGIDIKNLCVKAIQKTSERQRRKGTIGTSVLWAIAERSREPRGGLDVPGGTTVQEMPNLIVPRMQITNIRVETPRSTSVSWGKSFPLPETICRNCKNPIPLGYKECGICGKRI